MSVPVLETPLSRAVSADVHKKQIEEENERIKLNFDFLTQLLFQIPAIEHDLSSAFSEMWHFLERWYVALLAATLPWSRGQCQGSSKAAVYLPDMTAKSFLKLFPRFKPLLGPNYWEFDRSADTENVSLCHWVPAAVRDVKALEGKAHGCQAGEAVGWT